MRFLCIFDCIMAFPYHLTIRNHSQSNMRTSISTISIKSIAIRPLQELAIWLQSKQKWQWRLPCKKLHRCESPDVLNCISHQVNASHGASFTVDCCACSVTDASIKSRVRHFGEYRNVSTTSHKQNIVFGQYHQVLGRAC